VNKHLHTVASVGVLFTLNYDARNHEPEAAGTIFNTPDDGYCDTRNI